jgi:hypothetical protein
MSERRQGRASYAPAGRRRFQVAVSGSRVERAASSLPAGGSLSGTPDLPHMAVGRKGEVSFKAGSGAFVADRDLHRRGGQMGLGDTQHVQMGMADIRRAHKAGLLAGGRNVENMSRRRETISTSVFVQVDFTDMWRVAKGFDGIAVGIKRGHVIIARALNDGARTFRAGLARRLKQWTGIKGSSAEITRGFKPIIATAATMTAGWRIADRHRRITGEHFGAQWSRSNPGGTHRAWNRPQLARGSFMIPISRKTKIRPDLLFKRVGKARFPIAPLWGPNMVREIDRHHAEVQMEVNRACLRAQSAAVGMMRAAIAKAGR